MFLPSSNSFRFRVNFGIAAFSLIALFAGIRNLFSVIAMSNLLSYQVYLHRNPVSEYFVFLPVFLILPFLFREKREQNFRRLAQVLCPLLLFYPLLLFAWDNFFFLPLSLILFGWAAFRAGSMAAGPLRRKWEKDRHFSSAWIPYLVGGLYVAGVLWGVSMQVRAHKAMFLLYSDWGTYADSYLNLLKTGGPAWWNWLSTGAHWNPLVNLVMTGAIWIHPRAETIFVMNSAVIYSAVPLAYALSRAAGLSRGMGLFFAIAALLNPTFSHMNLTMFYGFHPVNFAIPLLLLFFLFREKGSRLGMGMVFFLSLMVQETMMIFWFGYGLYLLSRRQWRTGLPLTLFTLFGFFLLSSWILPRICDTDVYPQMLMFHSLGSTPAEVVLSPFQKASAFWSICFQWQNFAFLLTLMIPFFFCVWMSPSMLLAVVPLLAGICLRPSPDVKSVVFQYGVETSTLLLALAVLNVGRIMRKEHSRFPALLNAGMKRYPPKTLGLALCIATGITVLGAYYCFGMTKFIGKHTLESFFQDTDESVLIREMKSLVPPGSRVLSSERLRTHFLFDFSTDIFTVSRKTNDVLVMNLHDSMMDSPDKVEKVRRGIAFDRKVIPLAAYSSNNQQFVLFRIADPMNALPAGKLPKSSFMEFDSIGIPILESDPHFAGRYVHSGGNYLFLWQIRKTPEYDVDVSVLLECPYGTIPCLRAFGFGLFPAYSLEPGSVFRFEVNVPDVRNIKAEVIRRPFSDGKGK
ncbi:MAG: hypothetical protein BWY31_00074 [Lentisphaerae bacterium ADurb.Bin242]|nr:MAG: hypothetical protein BWY31_00074 [Lentisphaerae bacterium ADurb.Bin242]